MADIFWPAGISDIPLRDSITWQPHDTGASFQTEAGDIRTAPRVAGVAVDMTAGYPMTRSEFGVWLPWWMTDTRNGNLAFWLRCPMEDKPFRWIKQPQQRIDPRRDGLGLIVVLPLLRLPS